MKNTGGALKERLLSIIEAMGEHPERYAKNPGKDFARRWSLTLPTLISLILTMDEKSMWKGLLGYFQNGIGTPSASAFVQQRKKLLPQAFEDLFHIISTRCSTWKTGFIPTYWCRRNTSKTRTQLCVKWWGVLRNRSL